MSAHADAGELLRYRRAIGASDVRVFADIKKKHSAHAITADVDIAETARTLWIVYVIITIAGFIFLLFGGMGVFDAVNHIFCAMATGGFSTKDSSVAFFNSAYIDGVLVAFMIIAGMNFTLHHQILIGNFRTFIKDTEARFHTADAAD